MTSRSQKRSRFLVFVTLAALMTGSLVAGIGGCGGEAGPCVVFVILDTTRYDRFGYVGNDLARTVTCDSLARTGVAFTQTVSHVPVTAPSIASILSGVIPPVHGVRDNGRYILNSQLELMPQVFQEAGFRTGGVVSAVPILGRFGYGRGFENYDDGFEADDYPIHDPRLADKKESLQRSERRATAVTDRALAWLEDVGRTDATFMLVHYFDPHQPHDAPPLYVRMHPGRPYDAEVSYMDAELGRLLAGVRDRRGTDADIRVVVVGDHGEGLGQHEETDHGFFVYDATVRVPLIFSGTGITGGRRVTDQVRTQDVAATTCAWLGLPAPESSSGVSLLGALKGGSVPAVCDTAYLETFLTQLHYACSPLMGIRTGAWKWVKAPQPELYDLAADPGETVNLVSERKDIVTDFSVVLDQVVRDGDHRFQEFGAELAGRDPDLDRRLRSLGYATSEGSRVIVPDFGLLDPKEGNRRFNLRIQKQMHMGLASQARQAGQLDRALNEVEKAAALGPLQGREATFHGFLLVTLDRLEEAASVYRRALPGEKTASDRAAMRFELTKVLVQIGDAEGARAQWDTLQSGPGVPVEIRNELETLDRLIRDLAH